MAQHVSQAVYFDLDGQLHEIKRQLRQPAGYPFDPERLKAALQEIIEGKFIVVLTEAVSVTKPILLEVLDTVVISGTTERFVASEKFVTNYGRKAKPGVRISFLGDNFKEWFLAKIEEPEAEVTLRYAKLLAASRDNSIRAEIGTEHEETSLTHVFMLMERQLNGKSGALLTNGYANIFYIRDVNGVLRTVNVNSTSDGWYVSAHFVGNPSRWSDDNRVFFRNCCVSPAQWAGVLLSRPLLQPPSILPISVNCSEMIVYFLLSSALISQRT